MGLETEPGCSIRKRAATEPSRILNMPNITFDCAPYLDASLGSMFGYTCIALPSALALVMSKNIFAGAKEAEPARAGLCLCRSARGRRFPSNKPRSQSFSCYSDGESSLRSLLSGGNQVGRLNLSQLPEPIILCLFLHKYLPLARLRVRAWKSCVCVPLLRVSCGHW